jgi:hypothetical protein
MMIRQFRTASSLIGRRATLRYLGLGLIAAATTACGKTDHGTRDSQATATAGAKPSVTALAVQAFAKGAWKVTSTVTRGPRTDVATGELTVGDGTWSAGPGLFFDQFGVGGEYVLSGDRLTVVLRGSEEYRREYPGVKDLTFTGTGLPANVPGGAFILGWALGRRTQTCDTQWDGKTLTIAGSDFYDNSALVTATRA